MSCEANQKIEKERRRKYYEKNRYYICNYVLNVHCPKAIDHVSKICPDAVSEFYIRYPFEIYGEPFIVKRLSSCRITSVQAKYQDCYDAGMFAYLFSIHRCAYLGFEHVEAYIKKMIRIYVICALAIYDDTKNLCKLNGLKEVRMDADYHLDRY